MIGFYSIRKLVESKKLTNKISGSRVPVKLYTPTGTPVTLVNRHRLHELYDSTTPRSGTVGLRELCHQFIHSYIFTIAFDDYGKLSTVLVASDYQRFKELLELDVKTVVSVFEQVGHDDVISIRAIFDSSIGDFVVENH